MPANFTFKGPQLRRMRHSSQLAFSRSVCQNRIMGDDLRDIQKRVLPTGRVVITETMPHVRSVSVGIWIRTGSRREPSELNGISHFIEHMLFKGTERRTAEEIARSMDSVGGMLDAFTAKELVCFNARVLDEQFLGGERDRKSTRLNSSHLVISYAVFCLKKKKK